MLQKGQIPALDELLHCSTAKREEVAGFLHWGWDGHKMLLDNLPVAHGTAYSHN